MFLKSRCYIVLGLHRSGTSACAGILHHLGVCMGENLLRPDEKNPLGFYEDIDFINIHHKIISDWLNPQINFESYRKTYHQLLQKKSKTPLWGIKDPKMCFVFPYLLEEMPKGTQISVININRPIETIAKSFLDPVFLKKALFDKNLNKFIDLKITPETAYMICKKYQLAKEQALLNFKGRILEVEFNDIVDNPKENIQKLAKFVNCPITDKALCFIDPKLRKFK